MLALYFDGLFRSLGGEEIYPGNKDARSQAGVMCYGWLVYRDGVLIARGHGGFFRKTDATSNIAEYIALIEGLEALLDMGLRKERIAIFGDARSVIDQMTGRAAVNAEGTKPHYRRASRLARMFHKLRWEWTPRKKNKTADLLTRRAICQIRSDPSAFQVTADSLARKSGAETRKNGLLPLLDLRVFQNGGITIGV